MQAESAPPPAGPATDAAAPLLTGPVEMLWLLVLSILFIMTLVFVLLLRTRASRRARLRKSETEFFKPAGDGAEITFDDASARAPLVRDAPPAPKKNRGAFAGLFAQRDKRPAIDPGVTPEINPDAPPGEEEGFASVKIERGSVFAGREAADTINARLAEEVEAEREAQRRAVETERSLRDAEMRQRAAEDRDRQARLFEEEDRRRRDADFWQVRRQEDEARRTADLVPARFAAEPQSRFGADDYSRTLSEVEEAMSVQREAIQSETRALLDAFGQRLSSRLDDIAAAVDRGPGSAAAPSTALAEIARDMAIVRDRLDRAAAVDPAALQQELALLRQAITGGRDTATPAVQLADVIRNALPPDAYVMPANLSNSRRADCLIKLPRPSGPIAIDARFPVEAFNILRTAGAARGAEAESEFRRVAIRHVVDVAERMISPGETADSAILFLPSEAMYTELHQRFPDVIQDAWRARVWIVSPTSLLATLHTIQAALAAAEPRAGGAFPRSEDPRVAGEMTDLKRRIAALEDALARASGAPEPQPVMRAAPPPLRNAYQLSAVGRGTPAPSPRPVAGERIGDLGQDNAPAAEAPPVRPLFPLR